MPTSTTNYGLIKPGTDDPILIGQINDNMDTVDTVLKDHSDKIDAAALGIKFKGEVNYYSNLPNDAEIGDAYTVKYAGSSGTTPDGTEYVWGAVSGVNQWINFSKDSYSKAEVDALLALKQNVLTTSQLAAVNSGINSTKVEQIETNENNILLLESLNGGKNIARVASGTKTGSGYFLSNAKNTLTIPQNTAVYICFDYDVPSGQVSFQLTNSNGDVLSGTNVYTPTGPATGHKVQKVIPTTNDAKGYNAYNNGSGTVQISNIMIVPADIYEAGFTSYQPYALPNTKITPELIDLVDSGAKNKIFVDKLNTTNANGVTYTINSDGTITVNGTPSGSSPSYVVVAMPDGSTYKNFAEFCNGDNILSGCPTGGSTNTYRMYIMGTGYTREDFGTGVELTDTSVSPLYLILYIYNGYTANNLTFKPMICNKSTWDISHEYQPYRPSYQELYDMVKALQPAT